MVACTFQMLQNTPQTYYHMPNTAENIKLRLIIQYETMVHVREKHKNGYILPWSIFSSTTSSSKSTFKLIQISVKRAYFTLANNTWRTKNKTRELAAAAADLPPRCVAARPINHRLFRSSSRPRRISVISGLPPGVVAAALELPARPAFFFEKNRRDQLLQRNWMGWWALPPHNVVSFHSLFYSFFFDKGSLFYLV